MELTKDITSVPIAGVRERPVRILEVIGNASIGGMETYIKNFISNLPTDQFSVTCICPNECEFTSTLRKLGVEEVYITPIEDDPPWRSIQLTTEVARLHQVDVLHAHMPKAHVLAGLAGCLLHKPIVAAIHGMNVTSHELGIHRAVGSHLITNCQEAYTQGLAMGVAPDHINLVRNGVDLEVFSPKQIENDLRSSLNLAPGTTLVGFVGRLAKEKGPDLFVRAAEYVHHVRPDVHFVMIGDGHMHTELEEMCEKMHLSGYVHLVGWMEPAEVYPSLDILAHTSRSDGTSLVLLEAMACGCATVGIAVGGVREIIENECTGLIAGAGDWEGVGIKILQLLEHPEWIGKMGEAARIRVDEHFNIKTNSRKTADILRRIALTNVNGVRYKSNGGLSREIGRASVDTSMG